MQLRELTDAMNRFGRPYAKMTDADKDWIENESCNWRINWDLKDIPNYAKKIDGGLVHELCHQCGIIDLYQLGMHLRDVLVTDPNGHLLWVGEGCYHQFCDLMAVWGENTEYPLPQHGYFREHTAAGFNSEIGIPRWGFGLYLFDVPQHNVLRILDNRGDPIVNASVKLYQQAINDRVVGRIPPKVGKTDASGEWDLGSHPACCPIRWRSPGNWRQNTVIPSRHHRACRGWRSSWERSTTAACAKSMCARL